MNRLTIIGNLTNDPELRTTPSGDSVCSFGVAVNRRGRRDAQGNQAEQTDFFRVSVWRQQGENCAKYLAKGRKVAVTGPVSVSTYQAQDGTTRATLELTADDVEFLTPRNEQPETNMPNAVGTQPQFEGGFVEVDSDDLPF
jgi:single-strand DNA-binding protein